MVSSGPSETGLLCGKPRQGTQIIDSRTIGSEVLAVIDLLSTTGFVDVILHRIFTNTTRFVTSDCIHLEYGDDMFLRNVGNHLQDHAES
jgi:hypothetical protein